MSTPKSQMLVLHDAFLIKHEVFPLLDEKSLCLFSRTCKQYRDLSVTRRKAAELLFCVLNPNVANLKRMEELLSEPQADVQSIVLIRVSGQEVYFSKNQKTLSKRVWPAMSSLEAAFRCGDFPLVQRLVDRLPNNQRARALEQLQNVSAKCSPNEPGSYLYDLEILRKAYKEFLESYQTLVGARNWKEIDRLSGCIGEAQKSLSWFLLQVFCSSVPYEPIPDFTKESRRDCSLLSSSELNLDSIGSVSSRALYRALYKRPSGVGAARGDLFWVAFVAEGWCAGADSFAIDSLCEVLPSELDKIIKSLGAATPEPRAGFDP